MHDQWDPSDLPGAGSAAFVQANAPLLPAQREQEQAQLHSTGVTTRWLFLTVLWVYLLLWAAFIRPRKAL